MARLLRSRLGIVLVFGTLLLALDVGRSIWARVGLEFPTTEYRPDPALYADLTWPPGSQLDRDTPLGARVFAQRCAVCHGPDGKGNGPAAPSMFPRPRDFSSGISSTSPVRPESRRPMKTSRGRFAMAFLVAQCRTLQICSQPMNSRRS
jgi:Cytochrome c